MRSTSSANHHALFAFAAHVRLWLPLVPAVTPIRDLRGLIGDGHFLLPALTPLTNNEILSGEVGFEK